MKQFLWTNLRRVKEAMALKEKAITFEGEFGQQLKEFVENELKVSD